MRASIVAAAAVVLTFALDQRAAAQADPDAKGTITIGSAGPDPMAPTTVKVTGTRSAVNGWNLGTLSVFIAPKTGGRLFDNFIQVGNLDDPPTSWTVNFRNMPNGTYTVYAMTTVTMGTDSQLVGAP